MVQTERGGTTVPSLLRPLQGWTMLKPAYDPSRTESGIDIPLDARQRYPQIGWCLHSSALHEDISEGDLCIINVESSDVAHTYNRVFAIHLKDWGTELCEPSVEPAVREAVESYRNNPSTEDKRIRLETLRGEHLAFLCSDVLSYEWTDQSSPSFGLLYPLNVKMWWDDEGDMYYFVHEDNILGVIE